MTYGLAEKKCEICNKIFYPTATWVYKIKDFPKATHWYCSYTCLNKGKAKIEKNTIRKRRKNTIKKWK